MFRRPKIESAGPMPDPADLENRRNTERRNRLRTGGRQSTILAQAMERAAGVPTATLTGVAGS
ncbi:hypothetical protein [Brevundimonas sp. A19_0]|uniref:hypothetical protein n=1 Tax=Brevundimonas sp. A19_0 TaxID=2821087 RepID=UPI001ADC0B6A|nr:hypothetical protein [Brevundimonas sp. A19_0]MBO9502522.1 hypothetical protein [Brevundimonas sp. A19_0]